MKKIILALALVGMLTGCAQSSKPTPTPTKTKTQAEIEKDFLTIAQDSCDKANSENIIEQIADGSKTIVLAKSNAYKDYNAIYVEATGKAQVIYEMELIVCGPSYLISMQQEANHDNSGDYEHHIKLNQDGTYTWTQHSYGESGGLDKTIFSVANGIITAAVTPSYDYTFQYGPVSTADMNLLKQTIDAELERLNQ